MMNHPADQVTDQGCLASSIEIAVVWGVFFGVNGKQVRRFETL